MGGNQTDVEITKDPKPIAQVGPIIRPTVGRIVLYVPPQGGNFSYAADVAEVHANGTVMLFVKDPQLRVAQFVDHVAEDQTGNTPNSWHWPPRA